MTDLAPVALLAQMPYLLTVNPSLPAKSVQDVINLAKAQPGKLVFSSSGAGTSAHLTMEMFNSAAKLSMLHVPYKGGAPAVSAVMSGEAQMTFNVITGTLQHVRSGKLRGIAVSSAKRAEVAPEIPTVAESGVPRFEVIAWYNMFAPARTPRSIVNRLNAELNRMLLQPDVRERFRTLGVTPLSGTPEDLGNLLKSEIARYAKLINEAGIKLD
jgi:tripartite-type tricarboxylate transporter receptor subunit TctC